MAIILGNPTQNESFTEGAVSDVLKAATNIDAEKIKNEWEEINDDPDTTADRVISKGHMINDEIGGKIDKKIKDANVKRDSRTIKTGGSIIARSRNSVLQFPVYVTQSIRVNEAQIIAKLFERVYASYVQTALAQNPVLNEDEVNNLVFLKNFHTNIKESSEYEIYNEYYEPIDDIDAIMKESVYNRIQLTPTMSVEFKVLPEGNQNIYNENTRLMHEPLHNLSYLSEAGSDRSHTAIASNKTTTQKTDVRMTEDDIRNIALKNVKFTEDEREVYGKSDKVLRDAAHAQNPNSKKKEQEAFDDMKNDRARAERKVQAQVDKFKEEIKAQNDPTNKKKRNYYYDGKSFIMRNQTVSSTLTAASVEVAAPKLLRDVDIKKLNGMLPYTIEATFMVRPKDSANLAYTVHFIIGVKTVMHLFNVKDLEGDLQEIVTGNIKSLQKVRYKTGEIKFVDYVFNFKGLKADAAKRTDYNKRWISSLKRLADYNKLKGTGYKGLNDEIHKGKMPIPNGTMIFSQSDVAILKNSTGIDIENVSNAKRLAKSLFLISVCIVDPSAGSMKVLFPDSDSDWDIQSLASIDAELAKTDNSQIMRELNRMVNK